MGQIRRGNSKNVLITKEKTKIEGTNTNLFFKKEGRIIVTIRKYLLVRILKS